MWWEMIHDFIGTLTDFLRRKCLNFCRRHSYDEINLLFFYVNFSCWLKRNKVTAIDLGGPIIVEHGVYQLNLASFRSDRR